MPKLPKDRVPSVVHAKVCGPFSVFVVFDDGVSKRVNLRRRLKGPVVRPFRTPEGFAKLRFDHEAGTIVWSEQADIAPERLYLMRPERVRARRSKSPRVAGSRAGARARPDRLACRQGLPRGGAPA